MCVLVCVLVWVFVVVIVVSGIMMKKKMVEGSRQGGSGDKQGSKVVSPAATAGTFDHAATGWAVAEPPTHPNCPLTSHTH